MGNKIKENYLSWNINIDHVSHLKSVEDWARHLVSFAILAPSSHNSQPWLFEIENSKIFVYCDKKKELKVGDPENRFQYISVGCAIQNIKISADFYQIPLMISYFPKENNNELVAVLELQKNFGVLEENKAHLIYKIKERSTNRTKFLDKKIDENFFEKINAYLVLLKDGMKISWFGDKESVRKIGEVSAKCGTMAMGWRGFLPELSHNIKNNLTASKTGIPAFGMDIPTPVSFLVPYIIRFVNMDRLNEKQNIELFEKFTPFVGIIHSKDPSSVKDLVLAGEFFEFIALVAEDFGLKTSVWGAPTVIQSFTEKITENFQEIHNPILVFRIGFPSKSQPKSPRHLIDEVLIQKMI